MMSTRADRLRERLVARAAAKFALTTVRADAGRAHVEFTRVADPDAVLDAICEEETQRQQSGKTFREPLRMPYWAAVWESATAVGQHLSKRSGLLRGRVLDLGCGMGLAGMFALALNSDTRVTLADIDRDALLLARLNTLPWFDRSDVERVNWGVDVLPGEFDLIIGSDVLYERPQWDTLEPFLRRHLANEGAVLLGEPSRPKADEFPEWIAERGWTIARFEEHVEGRAAPLRLFELQR
jgi:predicted nicotinamide N-methyase